MCCKMLITPYTLEGNIPPNTIDQKVVFFARSMIISPAKATIWKKNSTFVPPKSTIRKVKKDLNRLKVVLAEKRRTNKWLAEQLGKDPATVSKWCTNNAQPNLENLFEIARCLGVDVNELVRLEALHEKEDEKV